MNKPKYAIGEIVKVKKGVARDLSGRYGTVENHTEYAGYDYTVNVDGLTYAFKESELEPIDLKTTTNQGKSGQIPVTVDTIPADEAESVIVDPKDVYIEPKEQPLPKEIHIVSNGRLHRYVLVEE